MRILFITYRLPNPEMIDGYGIRVLNIAKILKKKHSVDLTSVYRGEENLIYKKGLEEIFENIFLFKKNVFLKCMGAIRGVFTPGPIQEDIYYSLKMQKWIDAHYKNYDLVFCNTPRTARYAINLKINKVIDLIENLGLKYSEAVNFVNFFWRAIYKIEIPRIRKLEKEILNSFDKIFISSNFDKNYLLEDTKYKDKNKIVVIPNGVKEELLASDEYRRASNQEQNWISFFGKMTYQPNEDAAVFFAKKIFPKIRFQMPEVKFFIVGGPVSYKVRKLQNIQGVNVTGFVKDPYEIILKSKVFVCPLRFGAGILNKILEAMVLGRAVVTTPVGTRAIQECVDNKNIIIINDLTPDLVSNKILEILKQDNTRQVLGQRARNIVLKEYRWDRVGKRLLESIEKLK